MKYQLLPVFLILIFMFTGCDNNDPVSNGDSENYIEVVTGDVTENNYYYNLITESEDTTTWHVSYENVDAGGGYNMPTVRLNNTIMLEIYTAQEFNDIQSIPDDLNYSDDLIGCEYGHTEVIINEILHYDPGSYIMSVSNPSTVYICYDTVTHGVFKIQFVEYNSGILLFRFDQL